MILEKDLNGSLLMSEIMSIINDKEKMKKMGDEANKLADNKALDKVYEQIKELV